MDEVRLAAEAIAAFMAAGGGAVVGRKTAPDRVEYVVVEKVPEEGHVHAADHQDTAGWWCSCGRHQHRYVFTLEGTDEKRCQCGKHGIDSEWA